MEDTTAVAKKASPRTTNRFMVSFDIKYAETYDKIVADAEEDDRDPGEYLVRWLAAWYGKQGA